LPNLAQIQRIFNPTALHAFHGKRLVGFVCLLDYYNTLMLMQEFSRERIATACLWGLHGTRRANAVAIATDNFQTQCIGLCTGNAGFYGKGFYLSVDLSTALAYSKFHSDGSTHYVLLCQILLGNPYLIPNRYPLLLGHPCQPGCQSHVVCKGQEIVLFDNKQILPSYLLSFRNQPLIRSRKCHIVLFAILVLSAFVLGFRLFRKL
jgi:hypothetical protein